tara:strand:+ start:811 stop:1083 length:273 start_codon:yes stop_codon:yes gene_type:complete
MPGVEWWIGISASCLSLVAFVPQLIEVAQTRGRHLNVSTFTIYFASLIMWTAYGLMNHSRAIVVNSVITSVMVAYMLTVTLAARAGGRRA